MFLLYLYLVCFDGVIKGGAYLVGVPQLVLIKEIALFVLYMELGYSVVFYKKIKKRALFFLFVILFFIVYAILKSVDLIQLLFGLKLLLPIMIPFLNHNVLKGVSTGNIYFLLIVSFVGVLINQFVEFPWQGVDATIGSLDAVSSVSTDSNPGILKRVPGFSSTPGGLSFLVVSLYLIHQFNKFVASEENSFYRVKIFDGVLFLSFFTIILSTQKATLLALFFCLIIQVIHDLSLSSLTKKIGIYIVFAILITLSILLPVISLWLYLKYGYVGVNIGGLMEGRDGGEFFSSFVDRVLNTWPLFFSLFFLQSHNSIVYFLFGSGIGSVGPASKLVKSVFYNPGDNFVIACIAYFGFLGLIFVLCWLMLKIREGMYLFRHEQITLLVLVVLLGVGSGFNLVDNPVVLISAFGLFFCVKEHLKNKKITHNLTN